MTKVAAATKELMANNPKDAVTDGSGVVSVALVLKVLQSDIKSEIDYNLVAPAESAKADEQIWLHAIKINDPNVAEIQITAGENAAMFGTELNQGYSIEILPTAWYTEKLQGYAAKKTYLALSDFSDLDLYTEFPDLLSSKQFHVQNNLINGLYLAEGKWSMGFLSSPTTYRWLQILKKPIRKRIESMVYKPDFTAFSDFVISFGKNGEHLHKIGDLFNENNECKAFFDPYSGKVILTAKQDLGTVRFRPHFNSAVEIAGATEAEIKERIDKQHIGMLISNDPVVLDQIQELNVGMFNTTIESYSNRSQIDHPITLQKTVFINVELPRILSRKDNDYLRSLPYPKDEVPSRP